MSLNKVILIGNLGRDPEVRYMPNGDAVTNFSIATSENWTDRNTGQRQERTEWHNIVMYRRLAEVAGQYLRKGSQVYIEGKIQSRKYTGRDNIERTAYEIIASEMQMLGNRNSGGVPYDGQHAQGSTYSQPNQSAYDQQAYHAQPLNNQSAASQPSSQPYHPPAPPVAQGQNTSASHPAATAKPVEPISDLDDDIPF